MAEKVYTATISYTVDGFATVTARSKKEAIQKLKDGDYDDILDEEIVSTEYAVDESTLTELNDE